MKSRRQKIIEVMFWPFFGLFVYIINVFVLLTDVKRFGGEYDFWVILVNEGTGSLSFMLTVPLIISWMDRFPFQKKKLPTVFAAHFMGSFLYCIVFVGLLTIMRIMTYEMDGRVYKVPGDFFFYFGYEYTKYLVGYLITISIITGYRYYLADRLSKTAFMSGARTNKLLVKTREGEELVDRDSVDWLQAASNYVSLHLEDKEYLVRTTLNKMEKKLVGGSFVRVHRSFIVNIERIKKITPTESGDFRIHLVTGADIPLSRRFRENLGDVVDL